MGAIYRRRRCELAKSRSIRHNRTPKVRPETPRQDASPALVSESILAARLRGRVQERPKERRVTVPVPISTTPGCLARPLTSVHTKIFGLRLGLEIDVVAAVPNKRPRHTEPDHVSAQI